MRALFYVIQNPISDREAIDTGKNIGLLLLMLRLDRALNATVNDIFLANRQMIWRLESMLIVAVHSSHLIIYVILPNNNFYILFLSERSLRG